MPLDGLIEDKTRRTIFKERITTDIQQICRVDYESTALISDSIERELNQRVESFSQSHSSLIIEDYSKGTLTKAVIENAINHFSNAGKMVFVDPGRNTNPEFYKGVDLLKPNRIEAATMVESLGYKSQDTELAKQAEILMDVLDLKYLVITLGKDGVALLNRDEGKLKIIPTLAKEVFDVSGAGDTTIALLAASLSTGATLEESAWISNCGAGIVVGKSGTATLTTDELTLKSSNL